MHYIFLMFRLFLFILEFVFEIRTMREELFKIKVHYSVRLLTAVGLHGSWVWCTPREAWWRAKTSAWVSVATWTSSREFPSLTFPGGSKNPSDTLDGMVSSLFTVQLGIPNVFRDSSCYTWLVAPIYPTRQMVCVTTSLSR